MQKTKRKAKIDSKFCYVTIKQSHGTNHNDMNFILLDHHHNRRRQTFP